MFYKKERGKKKLPLGGTNLKAWPDQNFLIEMIKNKNTGWDWIMSSFIQIRGSHYQRFDWEESDTRITFYPYAMHQMSPNIFDLCPFIEKYNVPKTFVTGNYKNFLSFVREAIHGGYYISTMLDQFFREGMQGKIGFHHPAYIFGYDDFLKKIYLLDNFEKGKYGVKEISYSQLESAFELVQEDNWNVGVFLYRLKEYFYQFQPGFVKEQIENYLAPENSFCYMNRTIYQTQNYRDQHYKDEVYFGVDCYQLLQEYLQGLLEGNGSYQNYDWRSFVMLCDHKKLMKERYQFMVEHKCLFENEQLFHDIERMEKDCEIAQNLFLKYSITDDMDCIKRLQERTKGLCEDDSRVMKQFSEHIIISKEG